MGGYGSERPLRNSFLEGEVEKVAQVLAEGITPGKLEKEGNFVDSQILVNKIDWLQQRRVWDRVEKRVEEIRRHMELGRPGQLSFADMATSWGPSSEAEQSLVFDPESKINKMHIMQRRNRRSKLMIQDIAAERRQELRDRGYTQSNFRLWSRLGMERAIEKLKECGAWWIVAKPGDLTQEDIKILHEIISDKDRAVFDLDSSEGVTIYPSVAAWLRDVYGLKETL